MSASVGSTDSEPARWRAHNFRTTREPASPGRRARHAANSSQEPGRETAARTATERNPVATGTHYVLPCPMRTGATKSSARPPAMATKPELAPQPAIDRSPRQTSQMPEWRQAGEPTGCCPRPKACPGLRGLHRGCALGPASAPLVPGRAKLNMYPSLSHADTEAREPGAEGG